MRKLEERGEAVARQAQRRRIAEVARAAGELGLRAEVRGDGVALSGRRLVRRWLNEASLRFITGLMR